MPDHKHDNASSRTRIISPAPTLASLLAEQLRSQMDILSDETEADWLVLQQGWFDEYNPLTKTAVGLVAQAAHHEWLLLRAIRRYFSLEARLHKTHSDQTVWNNGHQHTLERALRTRIAAQRSFSAAFRDIEHLRSTRTHADDLEERQKVRIGLLELRALSDNRRYELKQEELKLRAAEAATGQVRTSSGAGKRGKSKAEALNPNPAAPKKLAEQLFQGQNAKKNLRKITILDQWVEVRIVDGQTITTLYPSNDQLIKDGQAMEQPPEMVYRRINFPDGVPAEYDWSTDDPSVRQYGGCGIQRMSIDTWLEVIEREKNSGSTHLSAVPNLPRPHERGGCDCPSCTYNRERLEAEAAAPELDPEPTPSELPPDSAA